MGFIGNRLKAKRIGTQHLIQEEDLDRLTGLPMDVSSTLYHICVVQFSMHKSTVIEQINRLLDSDSPDTSNTSMRIPTALRDAAALAVRELGVAPSATALTSAALRTTLEAVVIQAALDEHYALHPGTRPSLGDLAVAAAELDGHPLAAEPERLRRAAAEILQNHPDANPDQVVLWAEARSLPAA